MHTKTTSDHPHGKRRVIRGKVAPKTMSKAVVSQDESALSYAEQRKLARKRIVGILNYGTRGRYDRKAQAALRIALQKRLALYRPMVIARVRDRFTSEAEALTWFETGTVPGYGKSPRELVLAGHAAWVIEAIDAIEAGVHA